MSPNLRIAIVGGGPAGLVAGVLLHNNHIPCTIYELRPKPSDAELAVPSGSLDLHAESGIAAMRACGLYDEFVALTGECSEAFDIADRNGKVLNGVAGDNNRPEISRNNITKLLVGRLPADCIKWQHKLLSATKAEDSAADQDETVLDFGPHGKHTFDLVIGADGAWSRVRALLTDAKPKYSEMQIITLTIRNITEKYPHLAKLVGSGSFGAFGNRHGVMSQRGAVDSSRIYLWLTAADEHIATTSGLAGRPASYAKEILLNDNKLLGTFGPAIKELVSTACDEEAADHPGENLDIRGLYVMPYGSAWKHQPGATIIGDAAHVMLPNGEGVNQAMLDALLLSQEIAQAYESSGADVVAFQRAFGPKLKELEDAMVARAIEIGKETDVLIETMFGSEDAGPVFTKFMDTMIQNAMEQGPPQ